jgi:hypothetical protein
MFIIKKYSTVSKKKVILSPILHPFQHIINIANNRGNLQNKNAMWKKILKDQRDCAHISPI